jgi:16S rRNA (cytidine1402-2'-O)-methyltransferase
MSGTLSVVATPIGNLEDITLRALRILREARVIAAEDTRRTAKLLNHYSITTPTLSFHEHNSRARMPQLLTRLEAGEHVALVTDAGTPGVSDPGVELVTACRDRGITVESIPGASASLTAAVASGFPLNPLTVLGFIPIKAKDRKAWWETVAGLAGTVVFFESPHRISSTLSEIASYLVDRQIMVGRELTKAHEETVRSRADDPRFLSINRKGEFTIVIGPHQETGRITKEVSDSDVMHEFLSFDTTGAGGGRRSAITQVAQKLGLSVNQVYQAIERAKL